MEINRRVRVVALLALLLLSGGATAALAQGGLPAASKVSEQVIPVGQSAACSGMVPVSQSASQSRPSDVVIPAPVTKGFIMPGTGVLFTLPDEPETAPVIDCPPEQVRPASPDVFGEAAVPIRSKMLGADWDLLTDASLGTAEGPWSELLAQIGDVPDKVRLDRVNRWVNWHVRYVDDANGDVWSPAGETLRRGTGDCEDYAIAKMALLRKLGFPASEMFLVIVRQVHGQGDHAVLVVRREGGMDILDNRTDVLLADSQVSDYIPVLSYNGAFEWIYGSRTAGATASAAGAARH